jgi:hypothetical protein
VGAWRRRGCLQPFRPRGRHLRGRSHRAEDAAHQPTFARGFPEPCNGRRRVPSRLDGHTICAAPTRRSAHPPDRERGRVKPSSVPRQANQSLRHRDLSSPLEDRKAQGGPRRCPTADAHGVILACRRWIPMRRCRLGSGVMASAAPDEVPLPTPHLGCKCSGSDSAGWTRRWNRSASSLVEHFVRARSSRMSIPLLAAAMSTRCASTAPEG